MRSPYLPARATRALAVILFAAGGGACTGDVPPADTEPGSVLGAAATPTIFADGSLRGELVKYVADYDGHSEILHMLRDGAGNERRLAFDVGQAEPDLEAGTRLRVWGVERGEDLRVVRWEAEAAPVEQIQRPLLAGVKKPTRNWAFVLVNMGGGVDATATAMQDILYNANRPDSIRSYFREVSFGLQDLDGQVIGPLSYTPRNGCDSSGVVQALSPMIPNINSFSQVLWYFGSRQQCQWAGLAALGTAQRPQKHSWYNRSRGCVVLVQEPGHNFGMVHSSAIRCTQGGQPVPVAWPGQGGTCAHSEYGNRFDPMGSGCFHMDGVQKAYQDWISGCNVVKATTSGTFTIYPLEKACEGLQLLQIPLPAPRVLVQGQTVSSYFLELRTPAGVFDRMLAPQVHVTLGADVREARQSGNRNWLVDMNPMTVPNSDAALPVGRRYADPMGGPAFTVISADATKAVIKVEVSGGAASDAVGTGVCENMMPFTAPGPETCQALATPISGDGGVPMPVPADGGSSPPSDASSMTQADAGPKDGSGSIDDPPSVGTGGAGGGATGGAGGSPPVPPKLDAGRGASTGGTGGTGAPNEPASGGAVSGGCGCRTAPGEGSAVLPLVGLLAGVLVVGRRRRRR
jgi:MYXO-CTERM domain-containing protein